MDNDDIRKATIIDAIEVFTSKDAAIVQIERHKGGVIIYYDDLRALKVDISIVPVKPL